MHYYSSSEQHDFKTWLIENKGPDRGLDFNTGNVITDQGRYCDVRPIYCCFINANGFFQYFLLY